MRITSEEYTQLINKLKNLKSSYLDSPLQFGKYKGRTLRWIKSYDLQYIYWLADNTDFPIDLNLLDLPENNTFKQNISKEISADIEDTFIRDCRIEREQSQIEAYRREHGHGWENISFYASLNLDIDAHREEEFFPINDQSRR
jgi:hypothetical protein